MAVGTGIELAHHGEIKKESKYNVLTTLGAHLFMIAILYWGGFFDVFMTNN